MNAWHSCFLPQVKREESQSLVRFLLVYLQALTTSLSLFLLQWETFLLTYVTMLHHKSLINTLDSSNNRGWPKKTFALTCLTNRDPSFSGSSRHFSNSPKKKLNINTVSIFWGHILWQQVIARQCSRITIHTLHPLSTALGINLFPKWQY